MNAVFALIFIACIALILITSPESFLPALLGGAERSVKVALTLFCVYAVWLGLSRLAEKSGLSDKAARVLRPLSKKLFRTENDRANGYLAMNVACNLIGIGGAATPFAVKAVRELEKDKNEYAQKLLFIINATSIQILPTTVIALRAGAGSAAAFDIFLPSLICSAVSTLLAAGIYVAAHALKRKKEGGGN